MFDLNDKVLKLFQDSDALLQGHFKLTSGKHSEWYFEKIRLIEKPAVMDKIIDLLVEKIRREVPDFDYVVSPAYGAIALGFLAALKLGKKFAFTQRVEEKMAFRAGFSGLDGARAVIVEDILTTGGSLNEVVACLKEKNVAGGRASTSWSTAPAAPSRSRASRSAASWPSRSRPSSPTPAPSAPRACP